MEIQKFHAIMFLMPVKLSHYDQLYGLAKCWIPRGLVSH